MGCRPIWKTPSTAWSDAPRSFPPLSAPHSFPSQPAPPHLAPPHPTSILPAMTPLRSTLPWFQVSRGIFNPSTRPDTCIINYYSEGDCIPPHIDHHDFTRPFVTLSLLSEQVANHECGETRARSPLTLTPHAHPSRTPLTLTPHAHPSRSPLTHPARRIFSSVGRLILSTTASSELRSASRYLWGRSWCSTAMVPTSRSTACPPSQLIASPSHSARLAIRSECSLSRALPGETTGTARRWERARRWGGPRQ